MKPRRPRVIANFALTADGKVSTRKRSPTTFTSPADKRHLLEIRALGDAVLAGAATVSIDNMGMGLRARDLQQRRRAEGRSPEPLRVILSNSGRLDPRWKVFRPSPNPPVVFTTQRISTSRRLTLAPLSDLWVFEATELPLPAVLQILHETYRVRTAVCEGGPRLFRALLAEDAVDELRLTWTPLVFGGHRAPTLTSLPGPFLPKTVQCRLRSFQIHESECFLVYSIGKSRKARARAAP